MSTPRLLLIDNYDSLHLQPGAGVPGARRRGAACTATTRSRSRQAIALAPTHLCISPGPGTPYDAGVSHGHDRARSPARVPVLGVCLGHQSHRRGVRRRSRARAAGSCTARPRRSTHDGAGVFAGLPQPFEVGPLSLADRQARHAAGGARGHGAHARRRDHGRAPPRRSKVEGVQFHPGERAHARGPALHRQFPASMTGRQAMSAARHARAPARSRQVAERSRGRRAAARADRRRRLAPRAGRRVAGRAARQGRDAGRSARFRARHARAGAPARDCRRRRAPSTSSAPAAMPRAASTSRPARRCSTAACGVRVVKHGNRSVSSKSGSADVLEQLGLKLPLDEARGRRLPRRHAVHLPVRAALPPGDEGGRARSARRWACAPCSTSWGR